MLTDSVDQEFRAQQGSLFSVSLCMEPQVEHLEAEDWHHLKTFTLMLAGGCRREISVSFRGLRPLYGCFLVWTGLHFLITMRWLGSKDKQREVTFMT